MQKMTSAYASKLLKSLEEEKAFWTKKEEESNTYVAAVNEKPTIPEYDYEKVATEIDKIDVKIMKIKHALNAANVTGEILIGDTWMTIDQVLVRMAQLNKRKAVLDTMRKRLPKARETQVVFASRNSVPEYRYINYDLDVVKKDYERVSDEIMKMQMALDRYNQTEVFDVEI